MAGTLSADQIEALKAIDTPTICNAIEKFDVRGRIEGFLGMNIRCLLPELGSMVGRPRRASRGTTRSGRLGSRRWTSRPSPACW